MLQVLHVRLLGTESESHSLPQDVRVFICLPQPAAVDLSFTRASRPAYGLKAMANFTIWEMSVCALNFTPAIHEVSLLLLLGYTVLEIPYHQNRLS